PRSVVLNALTAAATRSSIVCSNLANASGSNSAGSSQPLRSIRCLNHDAQSLAYPSRCLARASSVSPRAQAAFDSRAYSERRARSASLRLGVVISLLRFRFPVRIRRHHNKWGAQFHPIDGLCELRQAMPEAQNFIGHRLWVAANSTVT